MQLIEPGKAGSRIRHWPRKAEKMQLPLRNLDWVRVVNAAYIRYVQENGIQSARKQHYLH
jgi:hypothetical protein